MLASIRELNAKKRIKSSGIETPISIVDKVGLFTRLAMPIVAGYDRIFNGNMEKEVLPKDMDETSIEKKQAEIRKGLKHVNIEPEPKNESPLNPYLVEVQKRLKSIQDRGSERDNTNKSPLDPMSQSIDEFGMNSESFSKYFDKEEQNADSLGVSGPSAPKREIGLSRE